MARPIGSTEVHGLAAKVGEKGGVSVYGLGRFPVTLYFEQWSKLLDDAESLRALIEKADEAGLLKRKDA